MSGHACAPSDFVRFPFVSLAVTALGLVLFALSLRLRSNNQASPRGVSTELLRHKRVAFVRRLPGPGGGHLLRRIEAKHDV
jgi:hypothetical protein